MRTYHSGNGTPPPSSNDKLSTTKSNSPSINHSRFRFTSKSLHIFLGTTILVSTRYADITRTPLNVSDGTWTFRIWIWLKKKNRYLNIYRLNNSIFWERESIYNKIFYLFYINEKVSQQDETKRNLEINIRSEIVDRAVTVTVK